MRILWKSFKDDYVGEEDEYIIFQLKENLTNKIMMVSGNVWDLVDEEFERYLNRI